MCVCVCIQRPAQKCRSVGICYTLGENGNVSRGATRTLLPEYIGIYPALIYIYTRAARARHRETIITFWSFDALRRVRTPPHNPPGGVSGGPRLHVCTSTNTYTQNLQKILARLSLAARSHDEGTHTAGPNTLGACEASPQKNNDQSYLFLSVFFSLFYISESRSFFFFFIFINNHLIFTRDQSICASDDF